MECLHPAFISVGGGLALFVRLGRLIGKPGCWLLPSVTSETAVGKR